MSRPEQHPPEQHPEDPAPRHDDDPRAGRHRAPGTPASWEQVVDRFQGHVAEVADPLTWGLDLDEETLTGVGDGTHDPTDERFLRSYVSYAGETLDVETLRVVPSDELAEEIVRTALGGALAAPLHGESDDDFLDSYQEYRAAMRAIVEEVDAAPLERTTFEVDGVARPCVRAAVRDRGAVLVVVGERAVVAAGPAGLLEQVDVVTAPLRAILLDDGRPEH
ncbi:hypothetical protein [Cellulosimicrobium cellulans]|uniref:hypothetical protein n=1 Tax=Cellulosimicrobium cellulans TaxID=1710 RepID=UPI000A5E905C|nr:hypothetical protein [Cellulosimicrobium cellulans]